jgi:hypothetical protein
MRSRREPRRAGDRRDMWPDDDGGTGQVLGCFGAFGAIIGSIAGFVFGFLTDNAGLKAIDNGLFLLAVPLAAWGVGLFIAFVWNWAVKRATGLGSPAEGLRGPGQALAAVVAGLAPAAAALVFILVVPWLASWIAVLIIAATLAQPIWVGIKRIWDVAR